MGRFRAAYIGTLWAGIVAATATLPALAHHSFSMFDHSKAVTVKGTVDGFVWENPHVHFRVIVPAGTQNGAAAGTWDVEGASTNIMFRQGWNRLSIKPGDSITVVGYPLKDGTKGLSLIYAITPAGRKLWQDVNRPSVATQG